MPLLQEAIGIMDKDSTVGKARLLPKYNNTVNDPKNLFVNLESYNDNFYIAPKAAGIYVQNSLRPSIWRKSFFLKLLNNPTAIMNPHQFETINNSIVFKETILIPKSGYPIFPDIDAMRQGRPSTIGWTAGHKSMNYYNLAVKEDDVEVFTRVRDVWKAR
jgi:hypothetical protein